MMSTAREPEVWMTRLMLCLIKAPMVVRCVLVIIRETEFRRTNRSMKYRVRVIRWKRSFDLGKSAFNRLFSK